MQANVAQTVQWGDSEFIFFRWLAMPLKWPVISVALLETRELQYFTFTQSVFSLSREEG